MQERTEKEWQMFLKTRTKREREAYNKRRLCKNCGHPILDINQSGYCLVCQPFIKSLKNKQFQSNGNIFPIESKTESKSHIILKRMAGEFLVKIGCNKVYQEYRGLSGVTVDVAGFKDSSMMPIVIECGGVHRQKLLHIKSKATQIYIFPYGEDTPYLWDGVSGTCQICGHKFRKD